VKYEGSFEFKDEGGVIVLELCQTMCLFDLLANNEMKKNKDKNICSEQILNGMRFLSSLGIGHNDLKSENILIGLDGYFKISDFGHSRMNAKELDFFYCGTPLYKSP
jgi:RAC serine/threonine-protein kinase